jgi:3-methylcrotonyl-CoA carboxylase alpha subunit
MMRYTVRAGHLSYKVEIDGEAPHYAIRIDGEPIQVDAANLGDASLMTLLLDNRSLLAHTRVADARKGLVDVSIAGKYRRLEVLDELAAASQQAAAAEHAGRFVLAAPMPGLVVAVKAQPGDAVQPGSPLVVMEAMKMQNELVSEAAGVVREVRAMVGQAVESGAELVVIEQ